MKYKFIIDGIGIEFSTIYRDKIETGIQYQIKELLSFWKSKKDHAFIAVYKRDQNNDFERWPFQIAKVEHSGEHQMITVEEWEKERNPRR